MGQKAQSHEEYERTQVPRRGRRRTDRTIFPPEGADKVQKSECKTKPMAWSSSAQNTEAMMKSKSWMIKMLEERKVERRNGEQDDDEQQAGLGA
jgi:hypothetical protein